MKKLKACYFIFLLLLASAFGWGLVSHPYVALGLLVLLGLALFFYRYTELALWLLIAYLPYQLALNLAPDIDLLSGRVLVLLLFLVWLIKAARSRQAIFDKSETAAALILFLILSLLSLGVAENPVWGGRKLLVFISLFPLFFLVSQLAESGAKAKKIFLIVGAGAALSSLIAICQWASQFVFKAEAVADFWGKNVAPLFLGETFVRAVTQDPSWFVNIGGKTMMRAIGFFPDPHSLAFYLGMTLPVILTWVIFEKKYKWQMFAIFCVVFFALLLTFSRGGYLGIAVALFLTIWLGWRKFRAPDKLFIGSLAALALFVFFLAGTAVTSRFFSSFNLGEGSNAARLQIWRDSLNMAKISPLLGVGLGNYPLTVNFSSGYRSAITSHNLYLDILTEMGIFGLLAWFWFLISAARRAWRGFSCGQGADAGLCLGLLGSLIYFFVHSFFETAIFNPTVLAFLMIITGLTYALTGKNKR